MFVFSGSVLYQMHKSKPMKALVTVVSCRQN